MLFSPSLENRLNHWNDTIRKNPTNIKAHIQRGMVYFQLAKINESIADFDKAEELEPEIKPYLWQRGLSYYYAERFIEGAQQFEIDLTVNSQDVEETVWRYLCIARYSGIEAAHNTLLPVKNDPRPVMRYVYDLYAGNCTIEEVLYSSESESKRGNFYSHLYLGLYYEAQNDTENASKYIVKAADKYQIDDYMWHLAQVHKTIRNW